MTMFHCLSEIYPYKDDIRDLSQIKNGVKFRKPKRWTNISDIAKDLIKNALTFNPHRRPTITKILAHAWFDESDANVQRARRTISNEEQQQQ